MRAPSPRLESWAEVGRSWGSTAEERALELPCDRFLADPADTYFRAVDVDAPAPVVFRWLCQLRVAPYSYDLVDNFGRRSPQHLTPGLEELELGQRFITIFDLVDFEPHRQITLAVRRLQRVFGPVALTYLVRPAGPGRSRLVVKLLIGGGRWRRSRRSPFRHAAPWFELVMMRRQLLNLRDLAEATARAGG